MRRRLQDQSRCTACLSDHNLSSAEPVRAIPRGPGKWNEAHGVQELDSKLSMFRNRNRTVVFMRVPPTIFAYPFVREIEQQSPQGWRYPVLLKAHQDRRLLGCCRIPLGNLATQGDRRILGKHRQQDLDIEIELETN
jgi:hypothetical protein